MGFEVPRKTYRLVFDDGDYAGAEVVCRSTSMAGLMALQAASSAEEMRLFVELALISWNLTADGVEIPATVEGAQMIPVEFYRTIVQTWLRTVTGVSGPLGAPSPAGMPSPELPIPMVTLSGARAS